MNFRMWPSTSHAASGKTPVLCRGKKRLNDGEWGENARSVFHVTKPAMLQGLLIPIAHAIPLLAGLSVWDDSRIIAFANFIGVRCQDYEAFKNQFEAIGLIAQEGTLADDLLPLPTSHMQEHWCIARIAGARSRAAVRGIRRYAGIRSPGSPSNRIFFSVYLW